MLTDDDLKAQAEELFGDNIMEPADFEQWMDENSTGQTAKAVEGAMLDANPEAELEEELRKGLVLIH